MNNVTKLKVHGTIRELSRCTVVKSYYTVSKIFIFSFILLIVS